MNCKVCGYKLTQLFTSVVCDRCDGLVPAAEAGLAGLINVEEDPEMESGWICIRVGAEKKFIPFWS